MMLPLILTLALAQAPSGGTLFDDHCAACHTGFDPRVPTVAALRQLPAESIVQALTAGAMRQQGAQLSDAARRAIAEYLTGSAPSPAEAPAESARAQADNRCTTAPPLNLSSTARWNGWGNDTSNARFQPGTSAGLTAS